MCTGFRCDGHDGERRQIAGVQADDRWMTESVYGLRIHCGRNRTAGMSG